MLPPLALAAGIDLYLTLLFLGAVPTLTWWDRPLPGTLVALDSPAVLIAVGLFYLLEFSSERFPPVSLVWNALQGIIRPLAGALLALLLLDGFPLPVVLSGAVFAGALALLAHVVRSGGAILRWLGSVKSPNRLLVSSLEDTIVLGLVSMALDAPAHALVVSAVIVIPAAGASPSHARAFTFAMRLALARAVRSFTPCRWMRRDDLPKWARKAVAPGLFTPGEGLRCSPAGAHRLPGAPRFATGWVVTGGSTHLFLFRAVRGHRAIDLAPLLAEDLFETGFFRRLDLRTSGRRRARVIFAVDGPSGDSLRAEFVPARRVE